MVAIVSVYRPWSSLSFKVEIWQNCDKWVDVTCIPESGFCLFVPFFFISFFSNLKHENFRFTCVRNCNSEIPTKLKVDIHMGKLCTPKSNGYEQIMYTKIKQPVLIHPCISSLVLSH